MMTKPMAQKVMLAIAAAIILSLVFRFRMTFWPIQVALKNGLIVAPLKSLLPVLLAVAGALGLFRAKVWGAYAVYASALISFYNAIPFPLVPVPPLKGMHPDKLVLFNLFIVALLVWAHVSLKKADNDEDAA